MAEPLFLIPFSSASGVQEVTSAASRNLFRRNQFSSFPRESDWALRKQETGSESRAYFFSTEPAFLVPSGLDWRRRKTRRSRLRRRHTFFRTEPLFLIPRGAKISGSVMASDRVPQEQFALLSAEPPFPHSLQFTETLGRTTLSPGALSLRSRCMEIVKFWQYRKRTRRCSDSFREHPDTILAKVAKEMAPLREMPNPQRFNAHQPCAGCVCRDRVIGQYDFAELAGASLKGSVAFHCGNTICDHEVNRDGRADVEDAFVNSAPVQ